MTATHEPYLKAIWVDQLVPYYDLVARTVMRERRIKRRVIDAARLPPDGRLLDVGCGTGTLTILAKQAYPAAEVVGIDGDPVILARARRKAAAAGLAIQLDEGMAYALPYADASFDAVVSTLTFHHLTPSQSERAMREVGRVLRPGGRLVIADFAPPHNRLMKLARLPLHLLAGLGVVRKAHAHGSEAQPHAQVAHPHAGGGRAHAGDAPAPAVAVTAHAGTERHGARRLAAHGWNKAGPPEYFMTLMGSLALQTLVRPSAESGARAPAHIARAG